MQQKRVVLHSFFMANRWFIKTVLCRGKSVFIHTSADKLVSAVIYNLFLLPVISRSIETNG